MCTARSAGRDSRERACSKTVESRPPLNATRSESFVAIPISASEAESHSREKLAFFKLSVLPKPQIAARQEVIKRDFP